MRYTVATCACMKNNWEEFLNAISSLYRNKQFSLIKYNCFTYCWSFLPLWIMPLDYIPRTFDCTCESLSQSIVLLQASAVAVEKLPNLVLNLCCMLHVIGLVKCRKTRGQEITCDVYAVSSCRYPYGAFDRSCTSLCVF